MLTTDEALLAGAQHASNKNFYLYTGSTYWFMSATYYSNRDPRMHYLKADGTLDHFVVFQTHGVRPVISLKEEIEFKDGDGSVNNPYIIE